MDFLIPPYCEFTIRTNGEFSVYDVDAQGDPLGIIGPDSANSRKFIAQTGENQRAIKVITAKKDTKVFSDAKVRPTPYETNSGIPSELSAPIAEPTIQEMIRMYVREAIGQEDSDDLETAEQFFDFDDDTDSDLLYSQYEEMNEEYLSAPQEPSQPLPAEQGAEGTAEPETRSQEPTEA